MRPVQLLTSAEDLTANLGAAKTFFTTANAVQIAKFVLLVILCIVVVKVLLGIVNRLLEKSPVEKTLHSFIRTGVKILLYFLAILVIASALGIDITSLIALLSVAGLAVSLAVQSLLSNLAGGLQVLAAKPFKVGDFVDIGGTLGTVQEINMMHTRLNSLDNKVIFIPNSSVAGAQLVNYSTEATRRVDLVVSTSYEAKADIVLSTLRNMVNADSRVLQDPAPFVRLSAYKDSCIEYTIRVWCAGADYWDVYFDILENTKKAFDANGIEMTYPHINVHMDK